MLDGMMDRMAVRMADRMLDRVLTGEGGHQSVFGARRREGTRKRMNAMMM